MAKNYRSEIMKTVLFKGKKIKQFAIVNEGKRDLSFTTKLAEATIMQQWEADLKIINFPSSHLQKILMN